MTVFDSHAPYSRIAEDAQGSPRFQETLTRLFPMTLTQRRRWDLPGLASGEGFHVAGACAAGGICLQNWQARDPTHRGFAGPEQGEAAPCLPLAGFRTRVCRS